jgi:putative colanic acid biosynthesis UDP-glucose lipid carrier transferase
VWQVGQQAPAKSWGLQLIYNNIALFARCVDFLAVLSAGVISGMLYQHLVLGVAGDGVGFTALAAVVAAVFVLASSLRGVYAPQQLVAWEWQLRNILWLWASTFLFFTAIAFALKASEGFSRGTTLSFAASGLVTLLVIRLLWFLCIRRAMRAGSILLHPVLLISRSRELVSASLLAKLKQNGIQVERIVSPPSSDLDATMKFRDMGEQIVSSFRKSSAREILILSSLQTDEIDEVKALASQLRLVAAPITLLSDTGLGEVVTRPARWIGGAISFELHRAPLSAFEQGLKRVVDIIGASVALVLATPVILLAALLVKLDSPGPVLFKQTRRGFNGRKFVIFKFRTMTVLEDGDEVTQVREGDHRLTRIGSWLRQTSIDELPQLLNVLRGEMSLVGPRPHAVAHDNYYEKQIANYALRQHVKPGITGWAQVNKLRGATPNVASMRLRVDFDLWYIDHWGLWLDLKILVKTIGVVLRQDNAF